MNCTILSTIDGSNVGIIFHTGLDIGFAEPHYSGLELRFWCLDKFFATQSARLRLKKKLGFEDKSYLRRFNTVIFCGLPIAFGNTARYWSIAFGNTTFFSRAIIIRALFLRMLSNSASA